MIVKIGNHVYSSKKEPILIILEEKDKENIATMGEQNSFCIFPDSAKEEVVEKWMNDISMVKEDD